MVGIVIVSHSAMLAEGVKELADQMVQGKVALAVAGGIDDPENPIGTDPLRVQEAIEAVYSDDGVLVLMDLGSALLSAEMALEFLAPEQSERVRLSAAPLVEGVLAAAVQASVGGTLEDVDREARGALAVKAEQLGEAAEEPVAAAAEEATPATAAATATAATQATLPIRNRMGLHARPAAQFVTTANRFAAQITVRKGNKSANAKSINQVATLGARQGDEVVVDATGPDAGAAVAALQALAADDFGEHEEEAPPATAAAITTATAAAGALGGIAASPGVAIGPAALYRPRLPEVTTHTVEDPAQEWERLRSAVETARKAIEAIQTQAEQQVGAAEAGIFAAHALFLQDPALLESVRERVFADHINAESAWQQEITATAAQYRRLEDSYMQARAADVEDVGQRVLRHLMEVEPPSLDFAEPSILVAADLTPSDTARLDPQRVLGICTELGGATAHSAILARALGIPAVVGLGNSVWLMHEGQTIAVDGGAGQVWPAPSEERIAQLQQKRQAWREAQSAAKATSREAAVTQDGHRVEIVANIGGPNDSAVALEYGAEGVGLFRTEFLFMERSSAPGEEEQLTAYAQVAQAMGQRPLIIRTLDVGGDKPLPYLDLGHEDNPFLGWRGIRFCLDRPEIFLPQLRAILRAGADESGAARNVKLMFPMVGTVGEIRRAKQLVRQAEEELRARAIPFDAQMEVGIMIEVPSAVAVADQLAAEVDFFSIGTNDLTQYTMAADRGNPQVADLAQALDPAVLRMVQQTVEAGHAAGIWVGMCGELAGNPLATPVLLGLGLDELSMSAPAIPAVKNVVRRLTLSRAKAIAADALALDSATAVTDYLAGLKL